DSLARFCRAVDEQRKPTLRTMVGSVVVTGRCVFGHFVRRDADAAILVDTREGGRPLPQLGTAIWSQPFRRTPSRTSTPRTFTSSESSSKALEPLHGSRPTAPAAPRALF